LFEKWGVRAGGFRDKTCWGSGVWEGLGLFGLLFVTLSVVEGSPADWLRSFGYAQDNGVLVWGHRVWAQTYRE